MLEEKFGEKFKYNITGDSLVELMEVGQWEPICLNSEQVYVTRIVSDVYVLNKINAPQLYAKYIKLKGFYKLPESINFGFITDVDFLRKIQARHAKVAEEIERDWVKASVNDYIVCDKCGGLTVLSEKNFDYFYEPVEWTNEKSGQVFNWHITRVREKVREQDMYFALRIPYQISGFILNRATGKGICVNKTFSDVESMSNSDSVLVYAAKSGTLNVYTPVCFKTLFTGVKWYADLEKYDELQRVFVNAGGIRALNTSVFGLKDSIKENERVGYLRDKIQSEIGKIEDECIRGLVKKAYYAANKRYWTVFKATIADVEQIIPNIDTSLAGYVLNTVQYATVLMDADKNFNYFSRSVIRAVLLIHKLCAYGLKFEGRGEVPEDSYLVYKLLPIDILSQAEYRVWKIINKLVLYTRAASLQVTRSMFYNDAFYSEHLMLCLDEYFSAIYGEKGVGREFVKSIEHMPITQLRIKLPVLNNEVEEFEREVHIINYSVYLALSMGVRERYN